MARHKRVKPAPAAPLEEVYAGPTLEERITWLRWNAMPSVIRSSRFPHLVGSLYAANFLNELAAYRASVLSTIGQPDSP